MPVHETAGHQADEMPAAESRDVLSPRVSGSPPAGDAEVRAWVVRRVAAALAVAESAVDTGASLIALGLDSLTLFAMTGELAEWLDRDLPASLLFEVASIDDLLAALAVPGASRDPA